MDNSSGIIRREKCRVIKMKKSKSQVKLVSHLKNSERTKWMPLFKYSFRFLLSCCKENFSLQNKYCVSISMQYSKNISPKSEYHF